MIESIASVLPSALGVIVSPVPIIAVVLMLMTPRATTTGAGFLAGWLVGLGVATAAAWGLVSVLPDSSGGDGSVASVLRVVLGLLLIILAVRNFRSPSDPDDLPAWMATVDTMSVGRAFSLGAALAALNPKNLVMVVAAADSVATAGATGAGAAATLAVFVVLAGASVALPVAARVVAADRVAAPLSRLKQWLVVHNSSVMGTLLLVLGVVLVSKGVGSA